MKQYIVDAFTEELFAGNPAAVLPCRSMPSADLMLKIAVENNYSETAFVVRKGEGRYDLKWFTPGGEVELCGHATLATSFVLHRFADPGVGEMHFDTLSGELIVRASAEGGYTMDFPQGAYKQIPVGADILAASGGLAVEAFYDGEGGDMIVIFPSEESVRGFVPNYDLIRRVDGRGFVITAAASPLPADCTSATEPPPCRYDFVSRCFYPKLNVPEDPVTGSAHTYLTPLWAARLGKAEMTARQLSRRGGTLRVRLGSGRVYITGSARLFMQGDIPFDL
ncbi:MAG: PhzF family phenazine biosynthesis protein [Bacteroidales bacterium]|nr:PhzF family phenazine biosynthesis protein [Bacteroidales bacterium]